MIPNSGKAGNDQVRITGKLGRLKKCLWIIEGVGKKGLID
jgi:hypothetical protein